jgi:hypothetical protein
MDISTLQTGAFEAINAQLHKDAASPSPAAKIQVQPTMAQELQQQKAAVTSSVVNKQPVGYVNLNGDVTGQVLNVKA